MSKLIKLPPPPHDTPCICVFICKDGRKVSRVATEMIHRCFESETELFRYYIADTTESFFSVYSYPRDAYGEYLRFIPRYRVTDGFTIERLEPTMSSPAGYKMPVAAAPEKI